MILYLFRHGETYYSKYDVSYGDAIESASILPEGKKQAEKIGLRFKNEGVSTIYSSPIKRCIQTVKAIKKGYPQTRIVYRQSLEEEKISRGLENLEDLRIRMGEFLLEIKNSDLQKVGVCTHGWPIAVLIAILKKGRVERKDLDNYPKSGELVIFNI